MTNTLGGNAATMQITPDWQKWVAENALRGGSAGSIVEGMTNAGFSQAVAQSEVFKAMQHPYVQAAAALGVGDQPPVGGSGAAAGAGGTARAKKNAWFLEVARRNAQQSPTYGTVPRVKKPSADQFLEQFYSQNRPCVIEGAMDDWAALTKWDGEYLKAKCGDKLVEVQANREADNDFEKNSHKLKKEINFGEFVDVVESADETNDFYITANNGGRNQEALKVLWDDIALPEYLTEPHVHGNGFFWYGPAGTVTPIHHDLTNNFMAQVRGRKRIKLVAPFESTHVYNDHHCFSPVDIENPDVEKFPEMKDVTIIDVEIGPGDLFFLPVGWWHGVRGLETSITMTFTNFKWENDFYSIYDTYDTID